ncbi:MAG TPA: hypothetical protein VKB52_07265 [Rhodanobacteraceae bacterium]|nr:hypothetical protein [Rhodanobacteraceae bacterium]
MDPLERDDAAGASRERAERKRARITEFGSLVALATSFLALSLSAYQARLMNEQTRLMQSQSRAGVWPYVSIGYSLSNEGAGRGYRFQINNDGVGPARIESVTMTFDGRPVRHWREVLEALFGDVDVPATYSKVYGRVLPPSTNRETTIDALQLLNVEQARAFYAAQDRIDMTICYCSVYDDCWIAHSRNPDVQAVARCERAAEQFEEKM